MKVKINKKIIIPVVILMLLCGMGAFVTCKTTLVAGMAACISEGVSFQEYVQVGMMPQEYNYKSYKDMLVYNIRVDKATERRELEETQRTELVYEPIKKLADIIFEGYSVIDTMATEQENLNRYQAYMNGLQLDFRTDVEKNSITDMIDTIVHTAHFGMATDVYFTGYTMEEMKFLAEGFLTELQGSNITEQFVIEQITPGEYDPQPNLGLAKQYTDDIAQIEWLAGTEGQYDYIVRLTGNYVDSTGAALLKEVIVAIVSEDDYVVVEAETVLYDESVMQIAAHGVVRPFNKTRSEMVVPEEPVVLQLAKMQEKAKKFVDFFYKILGHYSEYPEAYNEFYEAYYAIEESVPSEEGNTSSEEDSVPSEEGNTSSEEDNLLSEEGNTSSEEDSITDEEKNNTEVTDDTAVEAEEVDYESLQLTQLNIAMETELKEAFSFESEWPAMIILSNVSALVNDCNGILLTERFLNENKDAWDENGITEEEVSQFLKEADKIRSMYECLAEPVLVQERIILPEEAIENGEESEITNKNWADLQKDFTEGYTAWCEGEVPKGLYGGYYQYEFEGIATIELTLLYTEEGIFISNIDIRWADAESLLTDLTGSYALPNTVKMCMEAENAVKREQYSSLEAYEEAIQQWLQKNYPQYFKPPVQQSTGSAAVNYSYGGGRGNSKILNGIRDAVNTVGGTIENVWDGLGYALEGTLPGYLFTDNGSCRSFGDDVAVAMGEVKEEVNNIVKDVKNWWHGLWN